jgi:hypothetical protein
VGIQDRAIRTLGFGLLGLVISEPSPSFRLFALVGRVGLSQIAVTTTTFDPIGSSADPAALKI